MVDLIKIFCFILFSISTFVDYQDGVEEHFKTEDF